jgi:hypothetical protein
VVAEMVYTCLLCYVVLAVATVKDYGMDTFGLAIGFAIVAGGPRSFARARSRALFFSLSLRTHTTTLDVYGQDILITSIVLTCVRVCLCVFVFAYVCIHTYIHTCARPPSLYV